MKDNIINVFFVKQTCLLLLSLFFFTLILSERVTTYLFKKQIKPKNNKENKESKSDWIEEYYFQRKSHYVSSENLLYFN